MAEAPRQGTIVWTDLTVQNADEVRDFYAAVAGWTAERVRMGAYDDYNMLPPGSTVPAAGICHAREPNASLPAQWLIYIAVANLEESARRCVERGGRVVDGPRPMRDGQRLCVIQDPAGAFAGLVGGQAPSPRASAGRRAPGAGKARGGPRRR